MPAGHHEVLEHEIGAQIPSDRLDDDSRARSAVAVAGGRRVRLLVEWLHPQGHTVHLAEPEDSGAVYPHRVDLRAVRQPGTAAATAVLVGPARAVLTKPSVSAA